MSPIDMKFIRECYGVPAEIGVRVRHEKHGEGVIRSARNAYLMIGFDNAGGGAQGPYHPTSQLVYLDDAGNQIWPVLEETNGN